MARQVQLNVGDTAYYFASGHKGELSKGTVVHVFELYRRAHYVIEIPTHIDPVLEIRCSLSVSDAPDKPIGLWRGLIPTPHAFTGGGE